VDAPEARKGGAGKMCGNSSTKAVVTALLIHAAADGLAVGVAHMSESLRLAVAIGMAMVLHKGPVAFGFVSFLMSQGCSVSDVWRVRSNIFLCKLKRALTLIRW
jgi:zinc transporter ZupT